MATATLEMADGTKVTIEGTHEEIAALLQRFQGAPDAGQSWLTNEEGQPASERAGGFETTRGPWTVTDMGPADENTVVPQTTKSCGLCNYDFSLGGFIKGAFGLGVRRCVIRHCWVAGGRVYCIDIPFTEDCLLPTRHSWPAIG